MKGIIVISFLIFYVSSALARTDTYRVYSEKNERLGSLTVKQSSENGILSLHVDSKIIVKKFITISISYTLHSTFNNGKLNTNKIITYTNDRVKDIMTTKRTGDKYLYIKNKHPKEINDFAYCESMMYYNEPLNHKKVYSEFDGVFKSVKAFEADHKYELTNPTNHNVSKYWYEDGILKKAVVKHPLLDLYLFREGS